MPYPIIMNGDHAEFEAEWAASGKPDHERPDWPLPSFDAKDWAEAFARRFEIRRRGDYATQSIGYEVEIMTTWFANALMRGFDEARARAAEAASTSAALDIVERDFR